MNIKFYKCNVRANIEDDMAKVIDYFQSHNVPLNFSYEETSIKLPEWQVRTQLVLPNDGKYDVVIYAYDRVEQRPNAHAFAENFSKKTACIFFPTGTQEDASGFHMFGMAHELMHCLFFQLMNQGIRIVDPMDTYVENENVFSTTGNFAQAWKNLAPYLKPSYTYFSQKEVDTFKLKPEMWLMLDKARKIAQEPFIITSGYRTPEGNKKAGGVPNSAHLRGMAADILCIDPEKRTKMMYGLLTCGIPIFIEMAGKHLHISLENPGKIIISSDD